MPMALLGGSLSVINLWQSQTSVLKLYMVGGPGWKLWFLQAKSGAGISGQPGKARGTWETKGKKSLKTSCHLN